jgi:hypothetical protein
MTNVAFVWPAKDWSGVSKIANDQPVCSVAAWPTVLDCDIIGFDTREFTYNHEWDRYDTFIVNHFGVGTPISNLRRCQPRAKILALIDPALEVILGLPQHFLPVYHDLAVADAIGGRTKYDAQYYQAMVNVKAFWVPSPIGWYGAFDKYRVPVYKREEFLLTLDHPLSPDISGQNLAFAKAISKATKLPVKYVRPKPITVKMAEQVGHDGIEFIDKIPYDEFLELVAKCKFGFDLYWMHSQGRNSQTFAMCKTPLIGSRTTNPVSGIAVDPFDIDAALSWAVRLTLQQDVWNQVAAESMFFVERNYGFAPSLRRMENILQWMYT